MADKVIDDTNVGRLVSDIKAKADATYWPISDTEEINLATVATSGSYNDLTDKPTAATGALIYVGTCATAAATATKVVTTETFPLQNSLPVVGTTIAVKFSNSNTASTPKLDVNSTGEINIYYNTSSVTGSSATYGGTANRYLYYFYDGTYWVWLGYSLDANDNTVGYNLRTNATRKTVSGACYRYRILFTSADGKSWVPSNTGTSTNATASRTVNQTKIDPWGPIAYYGTTTALSSGGAPSASYLYQQYSSLTLGYSFNRTGAALTLTTQCPVWIKAAPQTDGSAIIDSDNPYVQSLPSTADGKIYILLGNAIADTTVDLLYTHPVYYYADGALRLWTNAPSGGGITVDQTYDGTSTNAQSGVAMAGALADKQDVIDNNNKLDYAYLSNTPTIPTVPTISTDISTDGNDDTKTASPKAVKTYVDAQVGDIATLLASI